MNKSIASNIPATINGIIQIGFSSFWIWHFGELLYSYHFHPLISYFFMYPNWTLILFILMAIFGVGIGFLVVRKKRKIISGYKIIIGLFILGLLINVLVIS